MLMPSARASRRRGDLHRLAVPADLAVVGPDGAVDDLHQRRLAGAVLAEDGVDLARRDAQARRRSLAFTAGYCLLMSTSSRRMGRDSAGGSVKVRTPVAALAGDERLRPGCVRRPSVIQAKTRSCNVRATVVPARRRPRRRPQSQTQTSAVVPGSSEPISRAEAERLRRAARRGVQRLPGGQALAGERLHLVGVGHVAQHRQAGAAADVARQADARRRPPRRRASRTGRCRGTGSTTASARSAHRRRASAARSASSSQMPCAKTLRSHAAGRRGA